MNLHQLPEGLCRTLVISNIVFKAAPLSDALTNRKMEHKISNGIGLCPRTKLVSICPSGPSATTRCMICRTVCLGLSRSPRVLECRVTSAMLAKSNSWSAHSRTRLLLFNFVNETVTNWFGKSLSISMEIDFG